ncbi:MAG TPA: sugar phosphate isomerase/epimerase [Bryobacteraceae bacterium]|nr:sugar phosphate isomerase/epimerase [Bryobacteraceae bacterium]
MHRQTTRRGFLGGTAAMAGIGALAASPQAARGAATDFKLGVASYSFRKFNRQQAIEMTKKCGVHYINIKDVHLPLTSSADEIAKAREEITSAGLIIEGGGNISLAKPDEADIRQKFEYAKRAGMPVMVCAPSMESLPIVEKMVEEFNIWVAIHNHGPEDKHFPTPQSVLKAVKNMDPRMGLCIDAGHTVRTGVDVVESVHAAGGRLHSMHIKDLRSFYDKGSQVPVGDGMIPIAGIFRELQKINYEHGVMLEYEVQADDPLPGMIKSFAYMRGVIAGLKTANV